VRLDAAQFRRARVKNDCLNVHGFEQGKKILARLTHQDVRKEVTIANDYR
jgi:hypothetical protein